MLGGMAAGWGAKAIGFAGKAAGVVARSGAVQAAAPWIAKHPGTIMAAVGGAGGYIGSGGSGWGLLAGAAFGGLSGRRGWSGGESDVSRRLAKASPNVMARADPNFLSNLAKKKATVRATDLGPLTGPLPIFGQMPLNRKPLQNMIQRTKANIWGGALSTGAMGGVGFGIGAGMAVGKYMLGTAAAGVSGGLAPGFGSSYGNERTSRYGVLFSGMGNGMAAGY